MTISVRNGMPWDYEQITVRPIELMRWRGQSKWNSVEPTKAELIARQCLRQQRQQLHPGNRSRSQFVYDGARARHRERRRVSIHFENAA